MKLNSCSPQSRESNSHLPSIQKHWPVDIGAIPANEDRRETSNAASRSLEGFDDQMSVLMSSSCGEHEGHAEEKACPSSSSCGECAEALHELANLMTGVLVNAQVLGWKLPPYSHLKRPVREVERNAQRGGELLKRLMLRCTARG